MVDHGGFAAEDTADARGRGKSGLTVGLEIWMGSLSGTPFFQKNGGCTSNVGPLRTG